MLELWSVNHILVDSEVEWQIEHVSGTGASDRRRQQLDQAGHGESYGLVCSQLRAAAEKRAGQLSKNIMNELERRLLQRAHSGWFETFLVAICLLNCVERSTWFLHTWDHDQYRAKVREQSDRMRGEDRGS